MVKRIFVLSLVCSVIGATAFAEPNARGFQFIKPVSFDRVAQVLISGKSRDYYVLEQGTRIDVTVQGPSTLRILSRAVLASPDDSIEYTYLVLKKGSRKAIAVVHDSRAAANAALASVPPAPVSASRTRLIDVPRGENTYSVYLPGSSAVRLMLRFGLDVNAFTQGTAVVAVAPDESVAPVDLVTREEVAPYYRVSGEQGLVLTLAGPATLKVLSRIEFDQSMNGRQKWKTQVVEDGQVKGTYSLSGRKSEVTTYREASGFVPSRAETFYVEIPRGEHRYEFRLPENHRSVLFRFLLPRSQLERQ